MTVLLDTNVVSEWNRAVPNPAVLRFRSGLDPGGTYLSAISIGELEYGILRLPAGRKKATLTAWLRLFEQDWGNRVLPIDLETAQVWGSLVARLLGGGQNIQPSDSWIAATAARHGLTLATRNTRDFLETGIHLVNPWES